MTVRMEEPSQPTETAPAGAPKNDAAPDPTFPPQVEGALLREAFRAQAREATFRFAEEHRGNPRRLEREIAKAEDELREMVERDPHGPMAPRTSVRPYRDSYIQSLRDAMKMAGRLRAELGLNANS
jgi:hypothetical protein